MVSADQIRAARALLRLEQQELARRAKVSITTIRRLEAGDESARVAPGTVGRVRDALETAGAEFITGGVRRRQAKTRPQDEQLFRDIMAIADRAASRPALRPDFSEADLYDESGLPG